ncbi:MAG TPA: UDP-N-acetylglucosamine 2-epimerase (non-hydrolyzing) [Polyangia bacterium]|jgi:UDP-N-acetylglucosamine 2-epimerase (non-hydrolysing)
MSTIVYVVGARPNYPKVAPLLWSADRDRHRHVLVHTGQHYDHQMSQSFFTDLGMPDPDHYLGVGSGTHAAQTARVMVAFEAVVEQERPDLTLVVGDVNSTLACALTAAKLGRPVAHLEAGLRSFDRAMPEELNRLLTDQLADLLLTPSPDADAHLAREGVPAARVHRVGNIMIDSLLRSLPRARAAGTLARLGLEPRGYALCTLHRPSNVDVPEVFAGILDELVELSRRLPVVFPIHPRSERRLGELGLRPRVDAAPGLRLMPPLGYLDFLGLTDGARLILTDSGGIQEESAVLGVPCLTLRLSTERPITVTEGTNRVVGVDPARIRDGVEAVLAAPPPGPRAPALWDGQTAARVHAVVDGWLVRKGTLRGSL